MTAEHRILIHAPIGKDGRLIAQLLGRADIACLACTSLSELIEEMHGGVGALLVGGEAIGAEFLRSVGGLIRNQPHWSDLPVMVLSRRDEPSELQSRYLQLGNVTLIERPTQGVVLVSAVRAALRGRARQYAMRELDQRKDEFLAMLAHELRNPLAPIRAASDLLRLAARDPERVQQSSAIIARQVKHMTELIDDLLDLSRVSRGLVTLDPVLLDARQIVLSAVEQVRPLVDARHHRLVTDTPSGPAFVLGDQKRLTQVLANVLNNAAKYTPDGGEITLAMSADADTVSYTVSDNGIGMPPGVLEHVFDMFAQAERSADRSEGGLGIGLALVKNLVTLHHGSVTAASAGPGQGSRFTVTLPRAEAPGSGQVPDRDAPAAASAPRLRLLVVDDNVDAGHVLGLLLESVGYQVTVVQDALAALERAAHEPPEVCLLDIGLPLIDGNELARRLRALPQTAAATLIAVTGYGQDGDRRRSAEAGFDHHFVKPVDIDELLQVLTRARAATQ